MFCLISKVLSALIASVWEKKSKAKKERLSSKEEKEVLPLFMYNEPQIFALFSRFFGEKIRGINVSNDDNAFGSFTNHGKLDK